MAPTTKPPESAPARWAPYLINGDDSGISATDRAEANAFSKYVGGSIVDCGDTWIGRHNGLIDEMTDYTILTEEE